MATKLSKIALIFMMISIVGSSAISKDAGVVDIIAEIESHRQGGYDWTCKGYAARGWKNKEDCLQDGRVHLVFASDANGNPAEFDGITFADKDKELLVEAAKRGAQILVQESITNALVDTTIASCIEVGIQKEENIVCSIPSRVWAGWQFDDARAIHTMHRVSTNGRREFSNISNSGGLTRKATSDKGEELRQAFRWFVRY